MPPDYLTRSELDAILRERVDRAQAAFDTEYKASNHFNRPTNWRDATHLALRALAEPTPAQIKDVCIVCGKRKAVALDMCTICAVEKAHADTAKSTLRFGPPSPPPNDWIGKSLPKKADIGTTEAAMAQDPDLAGSVECPERCPCCGLRLRGNA